MRLAIIHYHLRKGGVTRVIATALEALGESLDGAVVLSSTESGEPLPCPVGVVPGLAYDEAASPEKAEALYQAIRKSACQHLGGPPDIWHIHNHSLGKNASFPAVLNKLINDGERILLQIHDFAEDGRPGNFKVRNAPYAKGTFPDPDKALYPVAPQIGYAVLNGRDQKILSSAGIPDDRLFWLPNAVSVPDIPVEETERSRKRGDRPLILYPTRAIRRKNVGELLLLAATNPGFRFATTLSPKNSQWAPIHDAWATLGRDLSLPVEFALGEQPGQGYASLINEAHAMVTTSVGEGFGLAFLEPWLFDKPVTGRDLPEVTGDFKANGIQLPDLYSEWKIPCALFDVDTFINRFGVALKSMYGAYGRDLSDSDLKAAWQSMSRDGVVDFARLDEAAQTEALRGVCRDPGILSSPLSMEHLDRSPINRNTEIIRDAYGVDHYGRQLREIYAKLLEASPEKPDCIPADDILKAFLEPDRLRMLRS